MIILVLIPLAKPKHINYTSAALLDLQDSGDSHCYPLAMQKKTPVTVREVIYFM